MLRWLNAAIGEWRLWWHLCPLCNSDAPECDGCPVCKNSRKARLTDHEKNEFRDRYYHAMEA